MVKTKQREQSTHREKSECVHHNAWLSSVWHLHTWCRTMHWSAKARHTAISVLSSAILCRTVCRLARVPTTPPPKKNKQPNKNNQTKNKNKQRKTNKEKQKNKAREATLFMQTCVLVSSLLGLRHIHRVHTQGCHWIFSLTTKGLAFVNVFAGPLVACFSMGN